MKVLKFGGSSVGNPDRIRGVRKIVESETANCIVVVSAFEGITDKLKRTSELAAKGNPEYLSLFEEIVSLHESFAGMLTEKVQLEGVLNCIRDIFSETADTLRGIFLLKELSKKASDKVLSAGERVSSLIVGRYFNQGLLLDAREFIRTDDNFGNAGVDFEITSSLIKERIRTDEKLVIVPGFIGSTINNETTTLGRGGSDYTAAILASALEAEALEIWTDTDGFMTADPRKVEKAYAIDNLTYSEAIELSHFGAKVIYTPTLRPVYRKKIPVHVRNSFDPSKKGTLISEKPGDNGQSPIKGISSIDHIDLITLQGTAMVGVSGTSMRLFGALARHNINVILITQASSEYSITFALNPPDTDKAVSSIKTEFEKEIVYSKDLNILVEKDLSIIAIVGEKMKNTPGISATLFKSLGRNGINVVATAQGSSELNISVVIRNESLIKALNVIHDGFFLSKYRELHLFVAGSGFVGSSLLQQLQKQQNMLFEEYKLKINLTGITNSRKMLVSKEGIMLDRYMEELDEKGEKSNISRFIGHMISLNLRNSVFIDCTADSDIASRYLEILNHYISVVTANKIACSSDYSYYHQLRSAAHEKGIRFIYETTVGAGLPVIKTINDLVVSGDKIIKIEAVLSGTLNFIFNNLGPEMPLSKAVRIAREKGISEPDPRVDLSGTDVVRKILILSREAGYPLEEKEINVVRFLPDECFKGTIDEFFERLKDYDQEFEEKRRDLAAQKRRWRFFATMEAGKASVELLDVEMGHPAFDLEGSNNIILITTERYRELPMIIKGYGAGADVTAAGVFADLMRIVNV